MGKKDTEQSRYRARLVVGLLLEQQGVSADEVSAQQLLQAENTADLIIKQQFSKSNNRSTS